MEVQDIKKKNKETNKDNPQKNNFRKCSDDR